MGGCDGCRSAKWCKSVGEVMEVGCRSGASRLEVVKVGRMILARY